MELTQIDLSKIKAIGHDGQQLGLLFDRGDGLLEFATTPAPRQAMEGIRQLALMAAAKKVSAPSSNPLEITMLQVDSSNIKVISYAPDALVLQVDFLTGSRYRYFQVERSIFDGFIAAPSKGKFFNRQIKNVYEYRQV